MQDKILDHAKAWRGDREIVTHTTEGPIMRTTCVDEGKIAKWWMPDDVLFVDSVRLGATGKIDKRSIRNRFKGYRLPG